MCPEMGQHHFTQTTPFACPQLQLPTKVATVTLSTAVACPQSQIPTRVKQLARFDVITVVLLLTGALLECNGCRWESGSRLSEEPRSLHLHDPTIRQTPGDLNP